MSARTGEALWQCVYEDELGQAAAGRSTTQLGFCLADEAELSEAYSKIVETDRRIAAKIQAEIMRLVPGLWDFIALFSSSRYSRLWTNGLWIIRKIHVYTGQSHKLSYQA